MGQCKEMPKAKMTSYVLHLMLMFVEYFFINLDIVSGAIFKNDTIY